MITFTQLGNYGRLGNQMFQIASTIGYAIKNKQSYGFNWKYSEHFDSDIFDIGCIDINYRIVENDGLNFNNLIDYNLDMGNVDMFGYFQSHKYFDEYRDDVLEVFKLKNIKKLDTGFIHIRRGDYLMYPNHHPILPISYYIEGMNFFGKRKYYCLSDDIDWCKLNIDDDRLIFVDYGDEISNLKVMIGSSCAVIANSSYSWWGAYLGNHDNVIAPKNWFGCSYSGFRIEDRIPDRWIVK